MPAVVAFPPLAKLRHQQHLVNIRKRKSCDQSMEASSSDAEGFFGFGSPTHTRGGIQSTPAEHLDQLASQPRR